MNDEIGVVEVRARPTAVIATTITWQQFPSIWMELSNEVWTCLRASGVHSGCRNVMLYLDRVPNVEIGVELSHPCPLTGRVVASTLPAGRVATTVHRGSYAGLAAAHEAVVDWCAANGEQTTGVRWEIYGPHSEDVTQVWVEVYWLLVS